jgi:hypothetical protein
MQTVKVWLMLLIAYGFIGLFIRGVLFAEPQDYFMAAYGCGIAIWTYLIIRSLLSLTTGTVRANTMPVAVAFVGLWLLAIIFLMALYAYEFRYFGVADLNGLDPTSVDVGGRKITKDPLTCFYFAVVTWTTLGYGDFVPANSISRLFAALEALTGYVVMGVFIAVLINLIRPGSKEPEDVLGGLDQQIKSLKALADKLPSLPADDKSAQPSGSGRPGTT